jgi:hypothetical protein
MGASVAALLKKEWLVSGFEAFAKVLRRFHHVLHSVLSGQLDENA